jgi:beta-galactosidase
MPHFRFCLIEFRSNLRCGNQSLQVARCCCTSAWFLINMMSAVPNEWPDVNSHFGFLDIAGFLKERGYWHRVWLANPEPPVVRLFPHWNWNTGSGARQSHMATCDGLCEAAADGSSTNVTVFAFANVPGGAMELWLNGETLGSASIRLGGWASWVVPYAPGTLAARAYKNNSDAASAETSVETTGAAAALRVSIKDGVGARGIVMDGADVALVMVEVVDVTGRVVPIASSSITFSVSSSAAHIIGTGNGNPSSHTSDKSVVREAFNGLALAIIQSVLPPVAAGDARGSLDCVAGPSSVTVTASSSGLASGSIDLVLLGECSRDRSSGGLIPLVWQ